ncbi:MAG: sodium:alanine symporter family protein, partial [Ruminococcus sp.]|nr:sodium:alanine symporter family protein [Ruminococcus sp.]
MEKFNEIVSKIDGYVWGVPLIVLIMFCGLLLTARLGLLQVRKLGLALKLMFRDEEDGSGEVSSFQA